MEFSIGFVGRDFMLLAADTAAARSIVLFKKDENKILPLGSHTVMSMCGEPGDVGHFSEYVQKNLQLYKMRNNYEVSTKGMVNYARKALAVALRDNSYFVHVLIGGYDEEMGCRLYYLDYLASCIQVPFAAHGYGSYFVLSLLDRWHRNDMTEDDAIILLKKCMAELKKRFVMNLPAMTIRIVNKDGIRTLPILKEEDYINE